MQQHPTYQDILLIGGGHAHAIVLQMWAMKPLPGARLTLVSPQVQTPYSGMLPGMVAGHYSWQDIHIDLPRLCRAAGARFIQASAHQLNVREGKVSLLGRPDLEYDLLSLNVGAVPSRHLPGAELAVPIKPIAHFHRYWQHLQHQLRHTPTKVKFGVIGGGAGGCELAMAMSKALTEQMHNGQLEIHLVEAGNRVLQGYPPEARRQLTREFERLKVQVHCNWPVAEINQCGIRSCHDEFLVLDKVALCTQAKALPWLAGAGLVLDQNGFVEVDQQLRATGQHAIFAAGDIASSNYQPAPKAGVYAVRQGPVLFHNLRATLLNKALRSYRPQRNFLSLIACGNKRALASRNGLVLTGNLLWRLKDHIDRTFMRRFSALSIPMPSSHKFHWQRRAQLDQRDGINQSDMRCNGCGAKVGANVLQAALRQLPQQQDDNYLLRDFGDDAAILQVPEGKLLVQSSDQLRALVDDHWQFGRLAALHALSDLFAMHAQPMTAQVLVTLPVSAAEVCRRDLQLLLNGVVYELNRHHCSLSGGHTAEGSELQLGLTVNGFADREQLLHKTGARAGDCLIISKALGTGTIFAAEGLGQAKGGWLQQALASMLHSNLAAAQTFARFGAHALTDITGFGLLGHLLEMLDWRANNDDVEPLESHLSATLFANALPLLPGAAECAEQGIISSLYTQNASAFKALQDTAGPLPHRSLLVDPQTSGGLLAAVPAAAAEECLLALHAAGSRAAAIIGVVDNGEQRDGPKKLQPVRLLASGNWKEMPA